MLNLCPFGWNGRVTKKAVNCIKYNLPQIKKSVISTNFDYFLEFRMLAVNLHIQTRLVVF